MAHRSISNRSGILPASLVLALCASLLPQRTSAQGWQRVVDRADSPGPAVVGGADSTQPYAEVAEKLGKSEDAVKMAVSRMRQ